MGEGRAVEGTDGTTACTLVSGGGKIRAPDRAIEKEGSTSSAAEDADEGADEEN